VIVPLYGFVEGDTLGLLVLARPDMRVSQIVEVLCDAASVRVDPAGPWRLVARGTELPEARTVEELALTAFERIDLRRVGA
jgi:hypothetical protein